jgi:diadenosine tetraphosphate (Ap4A) HIT family hydrolase
MPWWPPEQWAGMKRGDGCPMCADAHLASNPFSDLLAETPSSFIRLHRNQTHAGYSVVIAKRHAPELHDLTADERCGFWNDVAATGLVITDVFTPVKLANLSMGFGLPHYHCHVFPQFQSDDPHKLIDVTEGDVRLDPGAWRERVERMRAALAAVI